MSRTFQNFNLFYTVLKNFAFLVNFTKIQFFTIFHTFIYILNYFHQILYNFLHFYLIFSNFVKFHPIGWNIKYYVKYFEIENLPWKHHEIVLKFSMTFSINIRLSIYLQKFVLTVIFIQTNFNDKIYISFTFLFSILTLLTYLYYSGNIP